VAEGLAFDPEAVTAAAAAIEAEARPLAALIACVPLGISALDVAVAEAIEHFTRLVTEAGVRAATEGETYTRTLRRVAEGAAAADRWPG